MQLTDIVIKKLNQAGRYTDDQTKGLHLWVKAPNKKYWNFRYTMQNQRAALSIGAYPNVGLRQARERAIEARNLINKGVDPSKAKKTSKKAHVLVPAVMFDEFALDYIETMRPKWRNQKHGDQWIATVKNYAFPVIGNMKLEEIETEHILSILTPIWQNKSETAVRLRGRLERIISAAITRGMRTAPNPAIWKGHLENLLPTQRASNKHHQAMPYNEIPSFMEKLRNTDGLSALALEFTVLNASRTGEVLLGLREEVTGNVWTIPGQRMKAGQQHQVPLCKRSIEILETAKSLDHDSVYLFSKNGKNLSNMAMLMMLRRIRTGLTVHGFRSSFRDWVSEETEHSPEVAEMALAHSIGNKVEKAYRRGKLLERRRSLMQDWESFCLAPIGSMDQKNKSAL